MQTTAQYDFSFNTMSLSTESFAQTNSEIGINLNGSSSFSVDAWVQFKSTGDETLILSKDGVFSFGIDRDSVVCRINGYPAVWSDPRKNPINERVWHFVCVTFDGAQIRIFIDGEFNTFSAVSGSGSSNSNQFLIGNNMHGFIKNVRVYSGTLDSDTVLQNMYNEPAPSSIIAYFDFTQNPPVDRSDQHLPLTLKNDASIVALHPALFVPGTAYAQPLQDENINPGGYQNDPYTVQTWIYISSKTQTKQVIFVNSDLERDTGMALFVEFDDASAGFKVKSQRGSDYSADNILISNSTVNLNNWVNIATTFDGVNLSIYINGALDITAPFAPISLIEDTSNLLIGASLTQGRPTGANGLEGYISRMEIWDKALTENEVQQYMNEFPTVPTENLTASYNLMVSPPRNIINGHPVGLADAAILHYQTGPAAEQTSFDKVTSESYEDISPEMLKSFRDSIDFSSILDKKNGTFFTLNKKDEIKFAREFMAEKDLPVFKEKIEKAWDDIEQKIRQEPGSVPFTVTTHEVNGYHVFVCHNSRKSYVAGKIRTDSISPCDLWKINLVFVVIAGILDALFGISSNLTDKAIRFILRIITEPNIARLLAAGTAMTAAVIFKIGKELYNYGYLGELVKLVIDVSFWTIIRITAKIILIFAGIGAADIIASLVATVVTFIKVYLERPASCDPLPNVDISAVQFNLVSSSSSSDALDIRKNMNKAINVPEWVPERNTAAESPAAYSIAGAGSNPVTIKAKFVITSPDRLQVQIKADAGGVLGAIDPFSVNFSNGTSTPEFVSISLPHHTIGANGILKEDIKWQWKYKLPDRDWTAMTATNHRIYVILKEPGRPWEQTGFPANNQLPWTDVLDFSCEWAAGKTTPDDAATAITEKVNGLLNLIYDKDGGRSKYTEILSMNLSNFLCTDFIEYLKYGTGKGNIVNCTDCATIVTSFANVLGCNLIEAIMHGGINPRTGRPIPFKCNKIISIGFTNWDYPFPPDNQFAYHEIAWKDATGVDNFIFDACLKINSGNDPWSDPGSSTDALLPTNIQFSTKGLPPAPVQPPFYDMSYRERLSQNTPDGIPKCIPQGSWPWANGGRRIT